jgi:hypothetical protein
MPHRFLKSGYQAPGRPPKRLLRGSASLGVFESYAQNNAPGAYRIFWHYGPDEVKGKKRTPVVTIVAITGHP